MIKKSVLPIFIFNGENLLQELNINGITKVRYITSLKIDDLIGKIAKEEKAYYHRDGLGSITILTNASQNIVASYRYDAFGNVIEQRGIFNNPYKFTARELDIDSGLYFYRARYYDPSIGRFISLDPIYLYVSNNPINAIDPLGLLISKTCLSGSIHIGAGGSVSVCFMQELGNGWNRGVQLCLGVGLGGSGGAAFTSTIATGNLDPGFDASLGISGTAIAAWFGGAMASGGCSPSIKSLVNAWNQFHDECGGLLGAIWTALNCGAEAGGAAGIKVGISGDVTGCLQYVW